jgi:hypothetical protein
MKSKARNQTPRRLQIARRRTLALSGICAVSLNAAVLCVCVRADEPTTAPSTGEPTIVQVPGADSSAAPGGDTLAPQNPQDLRTEIGVNPNGPRAVEVPKVPEMAVVGFVKPHDKPAMALLEISEKQDETTKRIYLVRVGTEIPVTITGHVSPVGHGELTGLSDAARPSAPENTGGDNAGDETQIILTVTKVTQDGVTVKAGLLSKTIEVH